MVSVRVREVLEVGDVFCGAGTGAAVRFLGDEGYGVAGLLRNGLCAGGGEFSGTAGAAENAAFRTERAVACRARASGVERDLVNLATEK